MTVRDTAASRYAIKNLPRFVTELRQFVSFPSISSQPGHAADVLRCARWLASHLKKIGFRQVRVFPTKGHPVVYAQALDSSSLPTVVVYGHYDVQPVDPLREWTSPPFVAVVRDGKIYGRGASDDKGQLFLHLKAFESCFATRRRLPVNVKCIFEGEEEIGSTNLPAFLRQHARSLKADAAVVSDTRMLSINQPALIRSLRGGAGFEITVRGPKHDLHSGTFGGAVHNPIQALCEILARMHNPDGSIAIPGFYDQVRELSRIRHEELEPFVPSDREILHDAETEVPWGEAGFSLYERTTLRPALTINGISGGYQGPLIKAVIPSSATAKLSFRLVADQNPKHVEWLLERFINQVKPPTVQVELKTFSLTPPAAIDLEHPAMRAAALAYQDGFGVSPVYLHSGGTIPVVNTLQNILRIPRVLMGFALSSDNMHAPNEKFELRNFRRGIHTCISFLHHMRSITRTTQVAAKTQNRPTVPEGEREL